MIFPIVCAFVLWYLYFGLEYALNGGSLGRNQYLMPFQCFWEEVFWNIPGGLARKAAYLRIHFVGDHLHGGICGGSRFWDYADVRANNLYESCARDVLPSPIAFWTKTLIVPGVGFLMGRGLQAAALFVIGCF